MWQSPADRLSEDHRVSGEVWGATTIWLEAPPSQEGFRDPLQIIVYFKMFNLHWKALEMMILTRNFIF